MGRCPEDVEGARVCGCSQLMTTSCLKSGDLLTLHYVMKMPPHVKRFVIAKVNKTRRGPHGGVWKPSAESCICNTIHYKDLRVQVDVSTMFCPVF